MQLSDIEIKELCYGRSPMISPFVDHKEKAKFSYGLGHFGYDIRLSDKDFYTFEPRPELQIIDTSQDLDKKFQLKKQKVNDGKLYIPPSSYALGVSTERFNIPSSILGICVGKSSLARFGITIGITPLEPGWKGYLTIEISNNCPLPIWILPNQGIAQIIFFRGRIPGKLYDGKYQNQKREVTTAR